jgi:hypothetical protein
MAIADRKVPKIHLIKAHCQTMIVFQGLNKERSILGGCMRGHFFNFARYGNFKVFSDTARYSGT